MIGQKVDGRTTYIVVRNIGGVIQMVGLNISPQTAADGTNYVALTLPATTRFTDTGFDSISVQADPHGAGERQPGEGQPERRDDDADAGPAPMRLWSPLTVFAASMRVQPVLICWNSPGALPNQRRQARWKALGSEKPSL
jgi:hypothetical protein